jgi:hypothetical protein
MGPNTGATVLNSEQLQYWCKTFKHGPATPCLPHCPGSENDGSAIEAARQRWLKRVDGIGFRREDDLEQEGDATKLTMRSRDVGGDQRRVCDSDGRWRFFGDVE